MRIVVVFPEPLGPSSPNTSPRSIVRSSPSTATNRPNAFRSPSARTAAPLGMLGRARVADADDAFMVRAWWPRSCRS